MAEAKVVRLLETKNWNLVFHRLRTKIAEVDLIFEKENQILLIEVKTLNNPWRAFERLHKKQQEKFYTNALLLAGFYRQKDISACVAWVAPDFKISFVKIL